MVYRAKLGIDLFRNEPNPAQGTRNKFGDELFILYRRRKNGDFPRVVGRKIGDTVEFVSSKYRSDIGDGPPCFDRRVSTGKCLPSLSARKTTTFVSKTRMFIGIENETFQAWCV